MKLRSLHAIIILYLIVVIYYILKRFILYPMQHWDVVYVYATIHTKCYFVHYNDLLYKCIVYLI